MSMHILLHLLCRCNFYKHLNIMLDNIHMSSVLHKDYVPSELQKIKGILELLRILYAFI